MGGTSFDTGIIVDNEIHIEKNLTLGLFHTGVNIVDVVSVGAGGGSIAWVGERGVPQVGPQSAGSDPGPAAYDRGGSDATVTDALVTLGLIDPERYLGGRVRLDPDLAEASLRLLASRFNWTNVETAAAVYDLVAVNMAGAVREVSVGKGHDPRTFMFLAYGGALPLFAMQIASRLGISRVVIPQSSSVFCALGLLEADVVIRHDRTVAWDLSRPEDTARVNAIGEELVEHARAEMRAEGFAYEDIEIVRSADFRFLGQAFELTMRLPNRPLAPDDATQLAMQFFELYERTYGEGTAWKGVPEQLLNYTVTATGRQQRAPRATVVLDPRPPDRIAVGSRVVFVPQSRDRQDVPIYADERFTAGSRISGPAIIDANDTTIFVPPATEAARDEFMNYVLTSKAPTQ
jgi:N-methylhydantoinase A